MAVEWAWGRLIVYTASTFVFGMICSALGPTIPWLAESAGVEAEALGYLSAAQSVMCIISGLASSLMSFVPRKYHHGILCLLLLWLAAGFALFPVCSQSLWLLTGLFALQVLPRPWIGQMTTLLVSELYTDTVKSSMAQSFNQGGFALGSVVTLILTYVAEQTHGVQNTFYMAAAVTAVISLLFLALPRLSEKAKTPLSSSTGKNCGAKLPSLFTTSCAGISALAVGVEVACGTWLITSLTQTGFSSGTATVMNILFWLLFAASRLALAPLAIRCFTPEPSSVVMTGVTLSGLGCVPAIFLPHSTFAVLLAVSALALGAGPAQAMTITMAKERKDLSSADSALFSVAASVGAGMVPFLASRILQAFGSYAFFPFLCATSALLLLPTLLLRLCTRKAPHEAGLKAGLEADLEAPALKESPVPAVIWMWWEQGWDSAPLICQACAESWKLANPEAEIRTLDATKLQELLPELYADERFWRLPFTQRSDLLRLECLTKYGGIWADATLFCTAPVMPWLQSLQREQQDFFFLFDRSGSATWSHDPFLDQKLLISSWFIASSPGHPLISNWLQMFRESLKQPTISYFQIHHDFGKMVADDELQGKYLNMPKVSAWHPHLVEFSFGFSSEATETSRSELSHSLALAPMQKLSHKILGDRFFAKILREGMCNTLLGSLFALLDEKLQRSYIRKSLRAKSSDLRSLEERETAAREQVWGSWNRYVNLKSRSLVLDEENAGESDDDTSTIYEQVSIRDVDSDGSVPTLF